MMEKTKAWQTWIPAWVAVLIVVIGWAFTIVYQAKGHVDEIQNLIQAYQKLDTRLDEIIRGLLIPNQGASKSMARELKALRKALQDRQDSSNRKAGVVENGVRGMGWLIDKSVKPKGPNVPTKSKLRLSPKG